MDGPGVTLMNMSIVGIVAETYILCIGGDLLGPVQGAVIMAFGYGAFGAHLKKDFKYDHGIIQIHRCTVKK